MKLNLPKATANGHRQVAQVLWRNTHHLPKDQRLPYSKKRKIFADSGILLTKEAGAYETWSRQTIKHRQAAMAKLAVSAWRFQ
jgi:hypothetical protein